MPTHPTTISTHGPVRAVSHRGDPARHPENTLAGIASALREGADLVEVDLRRTADGAVVLLHDPTLLRVWGVDAAVAETTLTELDARVRSFGGTPLLAEALALVGGTGRALLLDVDDPEVADAALAVVWTAVTEGWIVVGEVAWCGRPSAMALVRQRDPEARILLSWDAQVDAGALPTDDVVSDLAPEAFNPDHTMLTGPAGPAVFAWAAAHELPLCCWTVDDPALMVDLADRGVTAIITNRLDDLTATLRRPAT